MGIRECHLGCLRYWLEDICDMSSVTVLAVLTMQNYSNTKWRKMHCVTRQTSCFRSPHFSTSNRLAMDGPMFLKYLTQHSQWVSKKVSLIHTRMEPLRDIWNIFTSQSWKGNIPRNNDLGKWIAKSNFLSPSWGINVSFSFLYVCINVYMCTCMYFIHNHWRLVFISMLIL